MYAFSLIFYLKSFLLLCFLILHSLFLTWVTFYRPFVFFSFLFARTIPPFRPPSFVQRNEHTQLYYLYYLYVYIYTFIYLLYIRKQSLSPFGSSRLSFSLIGLFFSLFFIYSFVSLPVCSVLLLFFCVYIYNVCIVCI